MALKTVALDLPPLVDVLEAATALSKRKKPCFRALVQVMVNTKALKPNAVLALPLPCD